MGVAMIRISYRLCLQNVVKKSCGDMSIRLNHQLTKDKAFINSKWVGAASGKTFDVTNPSNGKLITSVPDMMTDDVQVAIDSAHNAFQTWRETTAKERSGLLRKWFELIVKNKEDLAKLMTAENGKPIRDSLGEIAYGASFVEWFAEEAKRIYGEVIPAPVRGRELVVIRQPIGVAALITPWNFPNAMITRKAGAALAAGCTCVIKPAEDTPLSALALAELAEQANIPPGVINVVTCDRANAASVGKLLCESKKISCLSFTGSTAVGKILYQHCASTVKRVALELGGNAPFIVFDSANLDQAVQGAIGSKFRNAGQACNASNRLYVQEGIHDEFVFKFGEAMRKALILADGFEKESTIGPLINRKQFVNVENLVSDAIAKGAKVVCGGKKSVIGDLFYEPTMLTNIKPDMDIVTHEIFGPVAPIFKFKTEDEVIKLANDTSVGLAGYFFSNDVAQCWRVAKRLESGMVGINEGVISTAEAPFGGIKESGIGREGSSHGIEEFVNIKYMCFGNLS